MLCCLESKFSVIVFVMIEIINKVEEMHSMFTDNYGSPSFGGQHLWHGSITDVHQCSCATP